MSDSRKVLLVARQLQRRDVARNSRGLTAPCYCRVASRAFHRTHSRRAYTLLEIILALALATVVLGLVAMAIHVNLGVADKSRGRVEEAQLARALLQQIADDLRNVAPYAPTTATTTPTSTTSAGGSSSSASSSEGSTTVTTSPAVGLFGNAQLLQFDASRRTRAANLPIPSEGDYGESTRLGDLKTITYSLGDPDSLDATTEPSAVPDDPEGGLFRREVDRADFVWATRQGQSDLLVVSARPLAPEIVDLQFTYYDGITELDTWNSAEQGKLPSAVKVAILIRRPPASPTAAAPGSADDRSSLIVYDMLIDLPNAQARGGTAASAPSSTTTSSSSPSSSTSSAEAQP